MLPKTFLVVALISATALSVDFTYDYNLFSSEWPGSVCKLHSCVDYVYPAPNWFNIHGYWPSTYTGTYPSYCTPELFNPDYLSPQTKADMAIYWNGVFSFAESFHQHEWQKHGTCWKNNVGYNS